MGKDFADKANDPLRKELETYQKQGVELRLDGQLSNPKKISHACMIAEDGYYMRDYTCDMDGDIKEISFDLIKQPEK